MTDEFTVAWKQITKFKEKLSKGYNTSTCDWYIYKVLVTYDLSTSAGYYNPCTTERKITANRLLLRSVEK